MGRGSESISRWNRQPILPKPRRGEVAGDNFATRCGCLRPSAPCMGEVTVNIESLDNEGRGIARADGKAVFVEGALPREQGTLWGFHPGIGQQLMEPRQWLHMLR